MAEITSLGLTYGLLTRYTSFIAVQEIVRRTTESADDVDQPLPLPAGVSDLAVGVTSGPEPDIVWLFAIVAGVARCVQPAAWRRRQPGVAVVKTRLVVLAVAVLIAWGLKRHYADARADDLGWILSPTARVVGRRSTGTTFVLQPGEGYFSRERLFLIEKSCAGDQLHGRRVRHAGARAPSSRRVAAVGGASAGREPAGELRGGRAGQRRADRHRHVARRASGRAVVVQAADVHRVEGIAVYFGGLVLLYELVQRFDRRAVLGGARAMTSTQAVAIARAFRRTALPLGLVLRRHARAPARQRRGAVRRLRRARAGRRSGPARRHPARVCRRRQCGGSHQALSACRAAGPSR